MTLDVVKGLHFPVGKNFSNDPHFGDNTLFIIISKNKLFLGRSICNTYCLYDPEKYLFQKSVIYTLNLKQMLVRIIIGTPLFCIHFYFISLNYGLTILV